MANPRFVIKAVISGQRLNISVPLTVAGTLNYISVEAKCTSEWNDCSVSCYIINDKGNQLHFGLAYDKVKDLYFFPASQQLQLIAGEWSIYFVGVQVVNEEISYRITTEPKTFTIAYNELYSSVPQEDIPLYEQAMAIAENAKNTADSLYQMYLDGDLNGEKGDPGDPARIGFVQASVDNTTGNPACVVTVTEDPTNTYNMQLAFSGIKGAKGDTGATGPKGDTGAQGAPGRDGTDGRDGQTIDDYVVVQENEPSSPTTKMWLKRTASGQPVMIPTVEEFEAIKNALSDSRAGETITFKGSAVAQIEKLVSTMPYNGAGYTAFRVRGYNENLFTGEYKSKVKLNDNGVEETANYYYCLGPLYVSPEDNHIYIWWHNLTSASRTCKIFAYDENNNATLINSRSYTAANQAGDYDIPTGTRYIKISFGASEHIYVCTQIFTANVILQQPFYGGEVDWINGVVKNLYNSDGSSTESTETFTPVLVSSFSPNTSIYTAANGINYLPTGSTSADVMLALQPEKSGLEGLHLSVLSDSMSTWASEIPSGNASWYPRAGNNVSDVNLLWWKKLCNTTGMIPLVIDAWSGSTIAYNGREGDTRTPMCSDLRTSRLAANNTNPDIIIVAGGTNDWNGSTAHTTPLGDWNGRTGISRENVLAGTSTFIESYVSMIQQLQQNYPNALIICTSLWFTSLGTLPTNGVVKLNSQGYNENDYSSAIEKVCKIMGVQYIDVYNVGFNYYNYSSFSPDNPPTHTNIAGQDVLAKRFIEELPRLVKQFK